MQESAPDPRHNLIRQSILELYAHNNPGLKCPWSGRTGTILKRILKQNPSWPVEAFIRCVDNRFASEGVNLSQAPDDWLDNHRSRLVNYARVPLDRFGAPKPKLAGYRVIGESPSDGFERAIDYFQAKERIH